LIQLRKNHPVLSHLSFETIKNVEVNQERKLVSIQREYNGITVCMVVHFGIGSGKITLPFKGRWNILLDSNDERWGGDTVALIESIDGSESVITAMAVKLYEHRKS
jgi:hypothetical protein